MGTGDEHGPLVSCLEDGAVVPLGRADLPLASIEVSTGVAGVVQDEEDMVMAQRLEVELAAVGTTEVPGREGEALGGERLDHRACRPGPFEGVEQVLDRLADTGVGVEDHSLARVIDEAHGQADSEFARAALASRPPWSRALM